MGFESMDFESVGLDSMDLDDVRRGELAATLAVRFGFVGFPANRLVPRFIVEAYLKLLDLSPSVILHSFTYVTVCLQRNSRRVDIGREDVSIDRKILTSEIRAVCAYRVEGYPRERNLATAHRIKP